MIRRTRSSVWQSVAGIAALLGLLAACGGTTADSANTAETDTSAPSTTASTQPEPPARCDWDMNTVAFWEANPPTEFSSEHTHGHGQGNEHGAQAWVPIADSAQCNTLARQIDRMEAVTSKYPTLQDAKDAGCFQATIYIPGIAAHLYCLPNTNAGTDIDNPTMLLYGGNAANAPIVGLSYMVYQEKPPNENPDADLWVKYMPWHFHQGLCIKGGLVIGGDNSDKATCEKAGGKVQGRTGWMGHYWPPNCPSPDGVFSAANPRLDWEVGKFNDANVDDPSIQSKPCQGSKLAIEPRGADRFAKPAGMDAHHGLNHEGHKTDTADDGHSHSHDA